MSDTEMHGTRFSPIIAEDSEAHQVTEMPEKTNAVALPQTAEASIPKFSKQDNARKKLFAQYSANETISAEIQCLGCSNVTGSQCLFLKDPRNYSSQGMWKCMECVKQGRACIDGEPGDYEIPDDKRGGSKKRPTETEKALPAPKKGKLSEKKSEKKSDKVTEQTETKSTSKWEVLAFSMCEQVRADIRALEKTIEIEKIAHESTKDRLGRSQADLKAEREKAFAAAKSCALTEGRLREARSELKKVSVNFEKLDEEYKKLKGEYESLLEDSE